MKIITDKEGYTTSIIILVMLIPLFLLVITLIDDYNHEVNNTVETIQSNKLKSNTEDFENQIITATKETLNNITLDVIMNSQALTNSKESIKRLLQNKIDQIEIIYQKNNMNISCTVKEVNPSNNPFKIEVKYSLIATDNLNSKISKEETKLIEITDLNYPVYDPLPTLKTGPIFTDNHIFYSDKLQKYIKTDNADAYENSIQSIIIKECPYTDYSEHGNDNLTIQNCLKNHYYHNSHDGLCLLCRLENKSTCNDYGFETFIEPTKITDNAPVSVDHVLLNNQNSQYNGNTVIINNKTVIYLDNGHKNKYGL